MQPEDKGSYWQPQADGSSSAPAPQFSAPAPAASPVPTAPPATLSAPETPALTWQASEYVHHEKQGLWFASLAGGALLLIAIMFLLFGASWTFWSFAVLVVVMTVSLGVYAVRPPRIMSYELSSGGIGVNERYFHYSDFRYFGIIQDGPLYSAQLVSVKRFVPIVSVYFPPESGEQIVDLLGAHLPMHHVEPDLIDKLMRRLRF